MTALPDIDYFLVAHAERFATETAPLFEVEDAYWGYIVRSTEPVPIVERLMPLFAWLGGIAFAVAGLGMWMLPQSMLGADVLVMKLGMTSLLAGFAGFLFWYASRGTQTELQIDTALGEVREVVRNHAGRSSLIGRYGFDSIGGVFLDREPGHGGEAALVLRYRNTVKTMPVARGQERHLTALRDRLGRDMMLRTRTAPRIPLARFLPSEV